MSEIISDKGIEWLHNEIETLRAENKALKQSIEKQVRVNALLISTARNRAEKFLKVQQNRDELLKELKEVESTGFLPDGDSINFSTMMWLGRLIERTETLKESK